MFNIISLLMQNACDLRYGVRKAARARLAARYRMLDHIRTVFVYFAFRDWSSILRAIATADLPDKPPRPTTASPQTKQSAVPLEIRLGKEKIENELIMRITAEERGVSQTCCKAMRESIPMVARLFMGWKVGNSHSARSTKLGYTLKSGRSCRIAPHALKYRRGFRAAGETARY